MKRFLLALLVALLPTQVVGQSTILQGGSYSAGTIPVYSISGGSQPIVNNSGPASGTGVGVREIAVIARGTGTAPYIGQGSGQLGTIFQIQDAPSTAAAGYHALSFSANVGGAGLIAYNAFGGAAQQSLNMNLNGSTYEFPFVLAGTGIIGPSSTTVGDLMCWNNTTGTLASDCYVQGTARGNIINLVGQYKQGGLPVIADVPAFNSLFLGANVPLLTVNPSGVNAECAPNPGAWNLGIGRFALTSLTNGCYNTAIGWDALRSAVHEPASTAVGYQALRSSESIGENTAVGYGALFANTTGFYNTCVGSVACEKNTSGSWNIALGSHTLFENLTGANNVAIGYNVLENNTTGDNSTAVGALALLNNTTGATNTAVGNSALYNNLTSNDNTAVGGYALYNSTGAYNTAIGLQSAYSQTAPTYTAVVGYKAAYSNVTGTHPTALGAYALYYATGNENIAIGYQAARGSAGLSANGLVVIGDNAGANLTGASDSNTLIGYSSGVGVTTGKWNTFLGSQATTYGQVTTGNQNIAIGYDVSVVSTTANGQMTIGNYIYGTGLTGTGNTISTAKIGLGVKAPETPLHVAAGGITINTGTAASSPTASGAWVLYVDSGDSNKLKAKASNGTTVTLGTP